MRALALHVICALTLLIFLPDLSFSQTVVSAPRPGTPGEWRYLGTVNARFTADHDAIVVQGPYDFFRKIKFKVTTAPINLIRLIVSYDDGGLPENIDTRFSIPAGGESRIIDLRGNRRKIRTVEFWYDTKGVLQGRANVSVFGQK
ncbi:MAG: hypothetical protein NTZ47_05900 [Bacteroidetes bacterium]|nr:hypothetical protein [Bacteroidota bacterium]